MIIMKIALVNLDQKSCDPPLGLAYIAAYLRKYGNFADIIIVDKEDILKRLIKERPDIVGITAMSYEFPDANLLAGKIKQIIGAKIIIGGSHISFLSNHLAESNFDIGVIGEGEQTMLELMKLFERKGSFEPDDLRKIKGIVFKNSGRNEITEKRPLIENLDDMPFPARDLLKMKEYYLIPRRMMTPEELGIYAQIFTSRGCPYKCRFCASTNLWQKTRFNSAQYVVGEIKELVEKFKVDGIIIWDDLFIADRKRVGEIAKLLKEEGLNGKAQVFVIGRANLIDEETCRMLKEMNVVSISFGLESGSDRILEYLKKGSVTVEQNRNALAMCKKFGFRTTGYFVIGSPGETEEDIMQTLSLVQDDNLDASLVFQLTPLPGTEIWDIAKKEGIVSDDISFDFKKIALSYKPDMLLTKEMSEERFKELYDLFQKESVKKYHKKFLKFKIKYLRYLLSPVFLKKSILMSKDLINYLRFSKQGN